MEILVNGRPRDVPNRPVSFETIAAIGCFEGAEGLEITWRPYAKKDAEKGGALRPGQKIAPTEGMNFTVVREGAGGRNAEVTTVRRG